MKTRYSFGGDEHIFVEVDEEMSMEAFFKSLSMTNAVRESQIKGVTEICPANASYQIKFDPDQISYSQLLDAFWNSHDPTTLNRQGPDVGTQYRSALFFHSPEQESQARSSKDELEAGGKYPNAIVTQIQPAGEFYRAEEYHQQYLQKRGLGSCHL